MHPSNLPSYLIVKAFGFSSFRCGAIKRDPGAAQLHSLGVSQDFFKLHALGLEYDAIIFYDTDMCLAAPRTVPQF